MTVTSPSGVTQTVPDSLSVVFTAVTAGKTVVTTVTLTSDQLAALQTQVAQATNPVDKSAPYTDIAGLLVAQCVPIVQGAQTQFPQGSLKTAADAVTAAQTAYASALKTISAPQVTVK